MLCAASDTIKILAYSALFFQVYGGIFNHIQCYWDIFKPTEILLRHTQAYSVYLAPSVTLAYSEFCHILSPSIFRTGDLFKTLRNVDHAYLEPCHRALIRHIQGHSKPCGTFAYAETWHTRNPGIFRTLK